MPLAKIDQQFGKNKPLIKRWPKGENFTVPLIDIDREYGTDIGPISEFDADRQWIEANQCRWTYMRILSFAKLSISGALTLGGLTSIVFDGWFVALGGILGGLGGLFAAVLCHVAGAEIYDE